MLLNAVAQSIEDLKAARVDREDEMTKAFTALASDVHNVLLYGTRGVGKTFLTRLLEDELQRTQPTLFVCTANLANLSAYQPGADEADAFPRAVLLQLCSAIWTRQIGKPYLKLKEHLSSSGHKIRGTSRAESTVQDIFAQLMRQDLVHRVSRTNTAGMNLLAKGEMQEQFFHENKQAPLLPFEFGEFVKQLTEDVLHPAGKDKIVVLCDEANHAKFYEQEQILERYFELFSSRRVQFLFVAAQGPWQQKEYIPACFETTIELRGFKEARHVRELIDSGAHRALGPETRFSPEALEVLIDAFDGHPRITLTACARAIELSRQGASKLIGLKETLRACRDTERRLQEYEKSVRDIAATDA